MNRNEGVRGYLGYERLNNVATPERLVALQGLMDNNQERQTPTNSPDQLPHPHSLYAAIIPILNFAYAYFGGELKARGSLTRHAAMAADVFDEARQHEDMGFYRSSHSYVGSFLRFDVLPPLMGDLKEIKQRSPEIAAAFRYLLPGPDFDIRIPGPEKHGIKEKVLFSNHEKFFLAMSHTILPLISEAIAEKNHIKISGTINDWLTQQGKELRKAKIPRCIPPLSYSPDSHRVKIMKDLPPNWIFAAHILTPVDIPPLFEEDYLRHAYFFNPRDLVILAKKIRVMDTFDIMSIEFCADLRKTAEEPLNDSNVFPIATIEFGQNFDSETANKIDGRSGTAVPTYDNAHVLLVITRGVAPFPNLILHYGEDGEWMETNTPFAMLKLTKETREIFQKNPDLGPDWEKRNPADAIDFASRVIWQSIDAQAQGCGQNGIIQDQTLKRIEKHLLDLEQNDPNVWEKIPNYQKTCVQKNLLNAMVISPHMSIEYFGKAGIWKILSRKMPEAPSWKECLNGLSEKGYADESDYLNQVFGDRDALKRHAFRPGWEIIDDILSLKEVFSEKTYLERIYRFTTI